MPDETLRAAIWGLADSDDANLITHHEEGKVPVSWYKDCGLARDIYKWTRLDHVAPALEHETELYEMDVEAKEARFVLDLARSGDDAYTSGFLIVNEDDDVPESAPEPVQAEPEEPAPTTQGEYGPAIPAVERKHIAQAAKMLRIGDFDSNVLMTDEHHGAWLVGWDASGSMEIRLKCGVVKPGLYWPIPDVKKFAKAVNGKRGKLDLDVENILGDVPALVIETNKTTKQLEGWASHVWNRKSERLRFLEETKCFALPPEATKHEVSLCSADFARVVPAMCRDESRASLCAVQLLSQSDEQFLHITATDGHRLHTVTRNPSRQWYRNVVDVSIPGKFARAFAEYKPFNHGVWPADDYLGAFDQVSGKLPRLTCGKRQAEITDSDYNMTSMCWLRMRFNAAGDGFPDWKKVFPDTSHSVTLSTKDTWEVIKSLRIPKKQWMGFTMAHDQGTCTFAVTNSDGLIDERTTETVRVDPGWCSCKVAINPHYILDMLACSRDIHVHLRFNPDTLDPIVFECNRASARYLIMPMRMDT